jgi:hypothetical protein
MRTKKDLVNCLKEIYFWDIDRSDPDSEISDRLIIERVFSIGDLKDIKLILDHYGRKKTVEILTSLNYLDPKTLNFVSKLFKKPKQSFKCYIRKLSMPQLWN